MCLTRVWASTRYFVTQGYLSNSQDYYLKNLLRYFSLKRRVDMHKSGVKSNTTRNSESDSNSINKPKNPDSDGKCLNFINNKETSDSFDESDKLSAPEHFSEMEQQISVAHKNAIEANNDTYKDPLTGYDVFTQEALLNQGKCCGNVCRHCPYGHINVPEHLRTKKFNSQFYI